MTKPYKGAILQYFTRFNRCIKAGSEKNDIILDHLWGVELRNGPKSLVGLRGW